MTFQTRFIDSSGNNFETRLLVISLIRHIPFGKNIIRIGQTVSAVFWFCCVFGFWGRGVNFVV